MIQAIKNLFSGSPRVDLGDLIAKGALIIDVRSIQEFASGHLKNSVNIPLTNLSGQMAKLNKDKPIITCCASGMRSSSAKSILRSNGFQEVHNGGSWQSLKKYEQ
ncbi:MAG: rhodanese-like domain-containing protein [Flavipsychrobacter sp.]|nr:rhodanese-like domain-containing protein [Flavipsychrobacter sp.]